MKARRMPEVHKACLWLSCFCYWDDYGIGSHSGTCFNESSLTEPPQRMLSEPGREDDSKHFERARRMHVGDTLFLLSL